MYYYHCVDAPRFPNILLCHFWQQRTVSFSNFRRRESLFKYLNTRNSVLKRKIIFRGEYFRRTIADLNRLLALGDIYRRGGSNWTGQVNGHIMGTDNLRLLACLHGAMHGFIEAVWACSQEATESIQRNTNCCCVLQFLICF